MSNHAPAAEPTPAYAYILPFASYLVFTQIATWSRELYPWLYATAVVISAGVTVACVRRWPPVTPHWNVWAGILVGIVGIVLWIVLFHLDGERYLREVLPGWLAPQARLGFNPNVEIADTFGRWTFVAVRLVGLAVVVPVVEELFWRGFLARWLLGADWQRQPFGRFTIASFLIVTGLFTATHAEWLAAAVYCALLNLLLRYTGDLWNCIVAHAVSNLLLGMYVLHTETWTLW
jgi:CAAX prenyl protease-like protein